MINKKQLREDIYNELFDSGRIAMHFPDESLDDRCMSNTNKIMQHVMGYADDKLRRYETALREITKLHLGGIEYAQAAGWAAVECARKALDGDYATEMQQTEIDSIKASGV